MSDGIDETYKLSFVSKTQKLLDDRVNETHTFLDASLKFEKGSAKWKQDLQIIDDTKPISSTNPPINPEIIIKSAENAYKLFKNYYIGTWLFKKDAYENGFKDLERYCKD